MVSDGWQGSLFDSAPEILQGGGQWTAHSMLTFTDRANMGRVIQQREKKDLSHCLNEDLPRRQMHNSQWLKAEIREFGLKTINGLPK